MIYLIDTNVIVRLVTGDIPDLHKKALKFFANIEKGACKGILTESVLAEAFYVLQSFYKMEKEQIIDDLQVILMNENILYENKGEAFEAFAIVKRSNLSFVDALLCAKCKINGYALMSFDKGLVKCVSH